VVRDAGRNLRMGELEEQSARPGAKEEHGLTVQRPRLGFGTIESELVGRFGQSSGGSDP
jgi:hypothetical protein